MTDQRACPTCPPGHQPRPLRGDHMICRGCAAALGQALASLPAVHAWLGHTLRRGAGQVEPVTGSREAPVPIDLAVHDHRVLIVDVLTSWARLITEEAHLSGPADTTLPTLTGWLRERLP
ncbi:MAG: hypothetical protein ACRDYV_15605, partial [Acidimicrobiia bacterium]